MIAAIVGLTSAFAALAQSTAQHSESAASPQVTDDYARLPMDFEANHGQTDPRVRFLARGAGYGVFLSSTEAVLALHGRGTPLSSHTPGKSPRVANDSGVLRMQLRGANPGAQPAGLDMLPGKVNYLLGSDPSRWRTDIATFAKVKFAGVYPGVDLVYYGNQRQLEYDFVVSPNADPKTIRLHFAGAVKLAVGAHGQLSVSTRNGQVVFHQPSVYQETDGHRQSIAGRFVLLAHHSVGFALGSYNQSQPLIIDPVLVYSTYLGGTGANDFLGDSANAIAADAAGNAYVAGVTSSSNFPIRNALQKKNQAASVDDPINAFVAKLNPTGTALLYSTYLGGTGGAYATAIAVDRAGDAYVTGVAGGGFPVSAGAFQTAAHSGSTGFVAALNSSGSGFIYSTYLGGSGGESANAIAVDGSGNAYVAGSTSSHDFPTTAGAFQTANLATSGTAFVTELNGSGTSLLFSTYLGGSTSDSAQGIALDSGGDVYVAGSTSSKNFPTTAGAYLTQDDGGFITKLNPSSSALLYSTYFNAGIAAIAVDASGSAYVTGAPGASFPVTPGAIQSSTPAGFITKMNADGTALDYSATIACGTGDSIAVDGDGNAVVAGYTGGSFLYGYTATCTDLPTTPGAFETAPLGGAEIGAAFVSKLNPTGTALLYSTFLAGSGFGVTGDGASAVAIDSAGNAYVAGTATSYDFPVTLGAVQTINKNSHLNTIQLRQASFTPNGFVTKLALASPTPTTGTTTSLVSASGPGAYNPNQFFLATLVDFGQPSAYVATVTGNGTNTVPTGSVTFVVNGVKTATIPLDSAGTAEFTASSDLKYGSNLIQAFYSGDSSFSVSNAGILADVIPAAPAFSPAEGSYIGSVQVSMSSSAGATIYYTMDGSLPTTSSPVYTGPIELTMPGTMVRAIAGPNGQGTTVISQSYAWYYVLAQTPTPVISPDPGTYPAGQTVTITDAIPTATIRYTTDGSTPTTQSNWYHGRIVLTGTETIRAIAISTGAHASEVASGNYSIH